MNQWGDKIPEADKSPEKQLNAKWAYVLGTDEEEADDSSNFVPLQSEQEEEARPRNRRTYKIKKTLDVLPDESGHSAVTDITADTEDSSSRLEDKVPDETDAVSTLASARDGSTTSETVPLTVEPLESIPAPVFDKSLKLIKKKKKEKKSRCSMMDLLDPPKFTTIVFNEY